MDEIPETPAVQASNENTAYILDAIKETKADLVERINGSDARTEKRFEEQDKVLVAHREQLGHDIISLTTEVRATNGGLKGVEARVGIIEYGEALEAKR